MDNFTTMDFNFGPNSLNDPFANIPMTDIDIGRESIPLIDINTSFGRESLGILKLGCDIENHLNNVITPNDLNRAFILSSHSDLKSASLLKSNNFSFNLKGHDQLSPINVSELPSSIHFTNSTNILNDGFLHTTALNEKLLQQYRSRFSSLPAPDSKTEIENNGIELRKRVSEGCPTNHSILEEEGNGFNDSVFIEARYLSTKFNDQGSKDGFILDDTDPPELINGDLENSNSAKEEIDKFDKEGVFKQIDKLLPVNGLKELNSKLDNRSSDIELKMSGKPSNNSKTVTDNESVGVDHAKDTTDSSCTKSIGESDKILQALSMILAKNDRSEKEMKEGQCLLNTLSEMLSNNSKGKSGFIVKDSCKSSDGTNKLRSYSIKSQNDSCTNSSVGENLSRNKKHSNSFSFQNKSLKSKLTSGVNRTPSFDGSKIRNSVSSAESSVEVRNYSADKPAFNLKLNKNTTTVRRGPMKATVPVENFTKPQVKGTPTKVQEIIPKLKMRIGTPVRDLQIKPVAQSTPDNRGNSCSSDMELTNTRNKSSSITREKGNSSSKNTSSCRDSFQSKEHLRVSQLPRRNSVNEGRKTSTPDLKRSTSMKESSLMKAMSKIRQSVKEPLRDCSNMASRENFSTSSKIITTPKRVMRTVGKENVSAGY